MLVVGAIMYLVNRNSPWSTIILNSMFVQFILVLALVELTGSRERVKKVRVEMAQHQRYQAHVDRERRHRQELEGQLELQASAGWRIGLQKELASAKAEARRLRDWCATLEWEREENRRSQGELGADGERGVRTWRKVSQEWALQAEVTQLQAALRALEESAQVEAQEKLQGTATAWRVAELEAELAQLRAAGEEEFRRQEEAHERVKMAWRQEAEQAVGTARQQGFSEGVEAGRREASAQNGFILRQEQTQGGSQFPVQQIVANPPLTNPQAFAAGPFPPVRGQDAPAALQEWAAPTATLQPTAIPAASGPRRVDDAVGAVIERNSLKVDAGSNAPQPTSSGTRLKPPSKSAALTVGKASGTTSQPLPTTAMQVGESRPTTGKWKRKR